MSLIEKYRLAFEISPVPMILVSGDGEIVLANEGFLTLFEYEAHELIGASVETLVPGPIRDHHPELRDAYHRVPTKRSMGAGRDLYGVTKSDQVIPLELGLEPVTDGTKRLALVAAIDIRQRKIHEQRMQQAMDAAASAMVMVDADATIVFVNRAASRLFGYDENDLLGQRVEMLLPEEFRRAHPVYTGSYMSNTSTRSMGLGRDLFARHRDGNRIPVEISLTPVDTPDGCLVMSTIIDLSERVAAAKEVERKNQELETLNIELSHFAYSASHDLKAPLSSITGLLSLCIEDLGDSNVAEVRENLSKAIQISKRSAAKVEGILRVARAGRDQLPLESIQLEPLVQEIWMDLTGGISDAQLVLNFTEGVSVTTEAATLKVIIENLLSNAVRYGDADKPDHIIRVSCEVRDDSFSISVADNGIGIPDDNKEKVFQLFKRLEKRSGDGLGLAIVKKQIDRLGGTVSLESLEGEGATFRFSLPIEGTENGQHTVVVVDDEETDRYIVKRRLSKAKGFEPVMEAANGEDFLAQFFNGHEAGDIDNPPLVVLMDVNMPRLNGFETIEELQARMEKGRGPDSIVIMMFTSSDNPADRAKADALDVVKGYILKPLDDEGVRSIRSIHSSLR